MPKPTRRTGRSKRSWDTPSARISENDCSQGNESNLRADRFVRAGNFRSPEAGQGASFAGGLRKDRNHRASVLYRGEDAPGPRHQPRPASADALWPDLRIKPTG